MKKNKQQEIRLSYIVLGLILGFFLGSGMVYWYFNRQNGSILYEKTWGYLSEVFERISLDPDSLPANTLQTNTPSPLPKKSHAPSAVIHDTIYFGDSDLALKQDSLLMALGGEGVSHEMEMGNDTLHLVSTFEKDSLSEASGEEIQVIQDRLLHVRAFSVYPPGASTQPEQYRLLDSILGNTSGRRPGQIIINIEFWVSPLQYAGYKKSHNRVIVYGLERPALANLHVANSSIFLEYMNHIFLLEDNDSFQPFESITDQEILDQFLFQ